MPAMQGQQPLFSIQQSQQYGRHLVASCDIPAGRVVLQQEPYACVLYDDAAAVRCDHCLAVCERPLRCGKSKFARYCSRDHQRAAWQSGFNVESSALAALHPRVPPATVRLAARCLLRRHREQQAGGSQGQAPGAAVGSGGSSSSSSYTDVEQLLCHWEHVDAARKLTYAQMALLVQQYMVAALTGQPPAAPSSQPLPQGVPDAKHIAQLLAVFACNNHTLCDDELRCFGVGLYPLGALVNHSCTPNCVQGFSGRRIVFRALRTIRAGEQLTISYCELAAPRLERGQQLLGQYFFDIDEEDANSRSTSSSGKNMSPDTPAAASSTSTSSSHAGSNGTAGARQQQQQQQQVVPGMAHLPPPLEVLPVGPRTQLWRYSTHPGHMDTADSAMSQVLVGGRELPGGMLLLQAAPSPEPDLGDDLLAAAARAAGIESLGQMHKGSLTGTGAGEEADMDQEDVQALLSGMDPAAAAAVSTQQKQQQQEEAGADTSVKYVVAYWQQTHPATSAGPAVTGAAAAAAVTPGVVEHTQQQQQQQHIPASPPPHQLVAAAQLLVHIQDATTEAEALLGAGQAGAALRLLASCLTAADSWQPPVQMQPPGGTTPTSAAAAAPGEQRSGSRSTEQQQGGERGAPRVAVGPGHVLRLRLLAALLRAGIEAQEWGAALEAARRLTPLYAAVYPKVWPARALHAASHAKLALLAGAMPEGLGAAQEALEGLRVTHPDSPVLTQVMHTAWEAQQELAAQQQQLQ